MSATLRPHAMLGLALCLAACAPPDQGPSELEVYLRSDLSDAERAGTTLTVHIVPSAMTLDAAPPLVVDGAALHMSELASPLGTLLGRFSTIDPNQYEIGIDIAHGTSPSVRADVAAVDYLHDGAQQVVFLILRSGAASCDATTPCAEAPCASAQCIAGSCFVLRATDWTAACECDDATDCPAATGCGASRCQAHACSVVPDDTRCGATERCRSDDVCDEVTCRGRAAGDTCRAVSSACDAAEVCAVAGGDCPPDGALAVGTACTDDDTLLPGACAVRTGSTSLVCDTRCEAGRPCQVGCRSGIQVCSPAPTCDVSAGGTVADGTTCGVAELCRAEPTCQAGTCTLGAANTGMSCGDDPAPDCVAAPHCTAEGRCEPTPAPMGTPCNQGALSPLCYGYFCTATGVCTQSTQPTDPRCDARGVQDECAPLSCSNHPVTASWGCWPQGSDDACSRPDCQSATTCVFTNTMSRGPYYACMDWGRGYFCERDDGASVMCSPSVNTTDCRANSECIDGMLDMNETDVDCGGPDCGRPCTTGQLCTQDSDCDVGCASGTCS